MGGYTEKKLLQKNKPLDMKKWHSLVEGWDGAKENQKLYCKRLGISINTFSYVRGKMIQKIDSKANSTFIPVLVSNSEKSIDSDRHLLMLENHKGLKLHIPSTLSVEQLVKIFNLCGWQYD